ncbi:unnamed protein product [Rotaria magnacalcarata]|uniref:Uncharacterized protein n=1 Tax=Rotaria magnacalcarata TaxID=392030 RepID=A0A816CEJ0_9BILA|nr:unnamed protein product [Rotaria magnacalcarata]CAF4689145.1 unnamed protein product [Rotaria magnacalcarata]
MQRPQRIRKPNPFYDPNLHVTIDAIDEQNGTVRSSGFVQPVRIIAEGSRGKWRERTSQFSCDTGSEEVNICTGNDDEDELVDENHVYVSQNFYGNGNNQHSPPTNTQSMSNVLESVLDFSLVTDYKHIGNTTMYMTPERDDRMSDEKENITQVSQNKNNIEKKTSCCNASSPEPLLIDEHPGVQEINQENSNILSNARDEMTDICEQGDEEDDIPMLQNISTKKKRKRTI